MADIFDGNSERDVRASRYDRDDRSDTMSVRSQDDTARYISVILFINLLYIVCN